MNLATMPEMFESSVILQGTKTAPAEPKRKAEFESSVILQGTKTRHDVSANHEGLRVV